MKWITTGSVCALQLGTLDKAVAFVVQDTAQGASTKWMVTGWSLPGMDPESTFYDSLGAAQNRCEQLLDLWLLKAGLEKA